MPSPRPLFGQHDLICIHGMAEDGGIWSVCTNDSCESSGSKQCDAAHLLASQGRPMCTPLVVAEAISNLSSSSISSQDPH